MEAFCELRLYQVEAGRMDDMIARLHGPLKMLFQRHGVQPAGCWHTVANAPHNLFVYIMNWPSLAERHRAWAGFYADPQWHHARHETNRGSELVERYSLNFLRSIVPLSPQLQSQGVHELVLPEIAIGQSVAAQQHMQNLPASLGKVNAKLLAAYECMTGDDLPRAAMFISWPNETAANTAIPQLQQEPLGPAQRFRLQCIPFD